MEELTHKSHWIVNIGEHILQAGSFHSLEHGGKSLVMELGRVVQVQLKSTRLHQIVDAMKDPIVGHHVHKVDEDAGILARVAIVDERWVRVDVDVLAAARGASVRRGTHDIGKSIETNSLANDVVLKELMPMNEIRIGTNNK